MQGIENTSLLNERSVVLLGLATAYCAISGFPFHVL